MPRASVDFNRNGFENEIRSINLTMRMRIRNADYCTLVFERQNIVHFRSRTQLAVLLLPTAEHLADLLGRQLGQRDIVQRAVADDPRPPFGWPITVDTGRRLQLARRVAR